METSIGSTVGCENCGTPLAGEYCHACGQRRIAGDWQSVPRFLRQFAGELVHLDFKTVRSVAALFNPVKLPAEFLAGRRRRYLGPMKVYFLCAAIFFFLGPLVAGFNLQELIADDTTGTLRRIVEDQVARKHMDVDLFAERFNTRFQSFYTVGLSVSVLTYALILKLLFRRAVPELAMHLIVALYYVAFFYLVALFMGALGKVLGGMHPAASLPLALGLLLPYAFLTLKRVYRESASATFWKASLVIVAGVVIDSPVNAAILYATFALI
jgi:hypothetical protein